MFFLTKQEKTVLVFFASVILVGSVLRFTFKRYPPVARKVNVLERDVLYPKLDINSATLQELIALPYIGEYTAGNIIAYRQENGPFQTCEEIKRVKGIKEKNFAVFVKYIRVESHEKK